MAADVTEISKLANVLHQNGDKVLNALSKLSLNATLLQKLNKEFEALYGNTSEEESFEVLSPNNSNSQLLNDLQFLHDFLQKTVGLKLVNHLNLTLLDNKIDLSKFKNLRFLEIKKIPIKEVIGLKLIQSQVESIVCIKCLNYIEELLAECGGDNSIGFVWSELKEAVLTYNNIKTVDTSIAFAPWLQVLDLSHNQISNVKAIECLPNLKYINLSFNCLDVIPTFSKSARKKMQVLVMKNNYIEDLSGLVGLDYLTELDLSCNWISNHAVLSPLLTMSTLENLWLHGNPISFHGAHRIETVGYLHISASFGNFLLDKVKLTKTERAIVGVKLLERNNSRGSLSREVTRVGGELEAVPVRETESEAVIKKKSLKVRLTVIPNLVDGTYEDLPTAGGSSLSLLGSSNEHLVVKKKLENARSKYGEDNWLRNDAGSVVQDLLGLPVSAPLGSTPYDDKCLFAALESTMLVTTTAVIEQPPELPPLVREIEASNMESFISCTEDNASGYYSIENSTEKLAQEPKEASPDIENIVDSDEEEEEEEEDSDENEKLYVVLRDIETFGGAKRQQEFFLIVTDCEIREKEPDHGRTVTKWSLDSLESCVLSKSTLVELSFDTIRRDKKERVYEMEEEEAAELYKRLTAILDSRSLSEMNQVAYHCFKCTSQFTVDKKSGKAVVCPFCGSKLVIHADDGPPAMPLAKPTVAKHNRSLSTGGGRQDFTTKNTELATSQSSIAVSGPGSPCIEVLDKRSAASLDELNALPSIQGACVKRCDSDIEILSNPSQSSIEVLDGPNRVGGSTPRRKRSSEERQVVPQIQVVVSALAGLTESSSSGSITESVCTAYDTTSMANSGISKTSSGGTAPAIEELLTPYPPTHLEAILQEALEHQTAKIASQPHHGGKSSDAVVYSYTELNRVDHRIGVLIHTNVLEDSDEDLTFLLRCEILQSNLEAPYPACLVGSTKRLYVLKVTGKEEGLEAAKFLQPLDKLKTKLSNLYTVYMLPWQQGVGLKIMKSGNYFLDLLILLKDPTRTNSFMEFLFEMPWRDGCSILKEPIEKPFLTMQHLVLSGISEDATMQFFSLFCRCSVIDEPDTKHVASGAMLTTNTELLLFSEQLKWLFDNSDQSPSLKYSQKLSNLMQVEKKEARVILHFLNEVEGKEELWCLRMETTEVVEDLVNALKTPWEDMFSVPLQITPLSPNPVMATCA